MAGGLIGGLKVFLGLDSVALEKGADEAEKRMQRLQKNWGKTARKMKSIGKDFSLAVSVPLGAFGVSAFKAASDAAELQSAFDQTFGAVSARMNRWAEETGDAMGRSTQEMQQAANTFGIFFNTAVDKQKAAEMSQIFAKLAQDLGSFYNVDTETAIGKLRSGLAGESEPMRDFGVFLSEATVKAKAMEMGLAGVGDELTEQEKILARYQLILEGTTNAQGDVERTSDQTANQMRKAKAAFEELQVVVGEKLLPAITPLIEKLAKLLEKFTALPGPVQNFAIVFGGLAVAFGPLLMAVGSMISGFSALAGVLAGGKLLAALKAVKAAMMLLFANPAILAAAGVIFGIYMAWKHWDDIVAFVDKVKDAVVSWWHDNVQPIFNAVGDAIAAVIDWHKRFRDGVTESVRGAFEAAKTWISDKLGQVWEFAKGAITAYVTFWATLPGNVISLARQIYEGVKAWISDKLNAIWDGAMKRIEKVKNTFFDLYDAVVGNSYIPDLVDGIDENFCRLPKVMVEPAEQAATAIKRSFADAADATIASFDRMASSIRGGGFLDILSSVIGLGLQLGSIGLFGKGVAANINAPRVPAYAGGTNFHAGGLALVGERGPELVSLPRGSAVHPNGTGPSSRIEIVPSRYFDVVVDGRIQQAAPAIAAAGGHIGEARVRRAGTWSLG